MIVGCYGLHLYCDNGNDAPGMPGDNAGSGHDYADPGFGEFTGQTEAECRRQARGLGWKFGRDGRVYCPRHAR